MSSTTTLDYGQSSRTDTHSRPLVLKNDYHHDQTRRKPITAVFTTETVIPAEPSSPNLCLCGHSTDRDVKSLLLLLALTSACSSMYSPKVECAARKAWLQVQLRGWERGCAAEQGG